jgi:hypothetical protein
VEVACTEPADTEVVQRLQDLPPEARHLRQWQRAARCGMISNKIYAY